MSRTVYKDFILFEFFLHFTFTTRFLRTTRTTEQQIWLSVNYINIY